MLRGTPRQGRCACACAHCTFLMVLPGARLLPLPHLQGVGTLSSATWGKAADPFPCRRRRHYVGPAEVPGVLCAPGDGCGATGAAPTPTPAPAPAPTSAAVSGAPRPASSAPKDECNPAWAAPSPPAAPPLAAMVVSADGGGGAGAGCFPVCQYWHLRAEGMPCRACSMCRPHPTHVISPQREHSWLRHIAVAWRSQPRRGVGREGAVAVLQ
jgi:hypothetical protein